MGRNDKGLETKGTLEAHLLSSKHSSEHILSERLVWGQIIEYEESTLAASHHTAVSECLGFGL